MHTLASFMYIYLYIRYIRAWLQAHAQRKRRKPIRFQTVHSDKMWGRKLSESRRVGSKTNHGFQKWRGCDTRTPMALCKKARSSQRAWTTSALLGKAPCYAKIYQYKNAVCTQESQFQRFSRMGSWHLLFFKSRSAWDRMYNAVFTLQDKVDNNVRGDRNWSLVNFEW